MIVAVMMVRDEADVISYTLEHLLNEGVDHVLCADNLSTDRTPDIVAEFDPHVTLLRDDEPGYYQDRKMSRLAHMAWGEGATWVVPCDADEVFYAREGTVADFLRATDLDVVAIQLWDHIATDDDNPMIRNPFVRITHRRKYPQKLPKVAFRADPTVRVHMGNHDVDHPRHDNHGPGLFGRHFQYRSFEQMVRKLTNGREAYEASDLHPMYGTHWREGGARSDDEQWREWRRLCEEPGLIEDPAPW